MLGTCGVQVLMSDLFGAVRSDKVLTRMDFSIKLAAIDSCPVQTRFFERTEWQDCILRSWLSCGAGIRRSAQDRGSPSPSNW
jgi:hypothetical protein